MKAYTIGASFITPQAVGISECRTRKTHTNRFIVRMVPTEYYR